MAERMAAGSAAGGNAQASAAGPQDGRPPVALPDVIALIAASIRRERARAGMSLSELARQAGIAKSTLSQLESGTGNPSLETLWALGVALGVPFSRLVDPARRGVRVIRAGEGLAVYAERASYAATLLASCPPGGRQDIYRVLAQPDEPRMSDPHMPATVEHVVMSTGRALVGPAGEPAEVAAGDYVTYPGDAPHMFRALEPDTTGVIILEYV
jgi:transcriptional regulator with XRE-family HTH domain